MEKVPTIQNVVDVIGNHIVAYEIDSNLTVSKSFGEVEVSGNRYQIQISLVPIENAISTSGVTTKK